MLTIKNLEKFTKQAQTTLDNIIREYCQHLFLSFLYQQAGSEKLLFKGGTALRIVFGSPRYSEDLDFTGINISQREVGIRVELEEGKATTGGYLGKAYFSAYGEKTPVIIQVSLRNGKEPKGIIATIKNDYILAYTLVHLPKEEIIKGKLRALFNRHKPRDFYDFFFLLSGNNPVVKEKDNLIKTLKLSRELKIDFRRELRRFLPASHVMHLRNFKKILEQKIEEYIGEQKR